MIVLFAPDAISLGPLLYSFAVYPVTRGIMPPSDYVSNTRIICRDAAPRSVTPVCLERTPPVQIGFDARLVAYRERV